MAGRSKLIVAVIALAVVVGLAGWPADTQARHKAGDPIIFTLRKDFIKTYKDKVTIDADMSIDQASPIHPEKDDGEIHIAGRAEQIGLPFVAEIMHAKSQTKAIATVRAAKGKAPIKVKGAWRIWCEHANGVNQTQGEPLKPFPTSNPSHVFEIHPITHIAGLDIEDSVGAPTNFKFKDAETAFTHYENVGCKITDNGDTVTIRTSLAGYNIPEFILESIDDTPGGFEVEDGRFLFASVLDVGGELLVHKARMAFIKGTEVEVAARTLTKGQQLHVAGIPRISLALVSYRVEHQKDPHDPLNWNLPYEVIVVGTIGN